MGSRRAPQRKLSISDWNRQAKGGGCVKRRVAWLVVLALLLGMGGAPAFATSAFAQTALDDPDSSRAENVRLAAAAVNQTAVGLGETFSFNAVVGPRTEDRGYVAASNGRGAEVVGGGVAQVATTLYLALCDLPEDAVSFDAVSFYGDAYAGGYVGDGEQAVLVDYSAGKDFCFTNLAADEMILEVWLSEGYVCCSVALTGYGADAAAVEDAGAAFLYGEVEESLPRETKIGGVQIDCGGDENVINNVELAAGSVFDYTLASGDTFSFNEVVGPRDETHGYCVAVNGRGSEVMGGGTAQVASAIWLSIKGLSDFAIVEKSTYGTRFTQSYVASSSDAIQVDYGAEIDFVFRYTGEGYVTIYTWVDDGVLRCVVYQTA